MRDELLRVVVACLVAGTGMFITLMLIRIAARLVLFTVLTGVCLVVVWQVAGGAWRTWPDVVLGSLAAGVAAGILCLPVLPFSGRGGK